MSGDEEFVLTPEGLEHAKNMLRTNLESMLYYLYIGRKMNKDNDEFLKFVLITIFDMFDMPDEKARKLADAFVHDQVVWDE